MMYIYYILYIFDQDNICIYIFYIFLYISLLQTNIPSTESRHARVLLKTFLTNSSSLTIDY